MRISDWSSDVCSSDLRPDDRVDLPQMGAAPYAAVCGALTPPATRRRWGRRDDEGAGLLAFKKSGQGMGREILPRLRASVRPLQLHRAVERPADRKSVV